MVVFGHIVEKEFGPSIGFHAKTNTISTCDIVEYIRIDYMWYRSHKSTSYDMLINSTNEDDFFNKFNKLKKEYYITEEKLVDRIC